MREEVAHFGHPERLVGIVTSPEGEADPPPAPAFILLNSGILHRVGPNRLHVTMARELAELGFLSFRFDLSGVGDSPAPTKIRSAAERWTAETIEAMDFLAESRGIREFILFGNCSGAAVAFRAAVQDPRVVGGVFVNLQGSRTYIRYYLRLALSHRVFWRRLRAGTARVHDLFGSLRGYLADVRGRNRENGAEKGFDLDHAVNTLAENGTRILLVYCEWDPGLDFFNLMLQPALERRVPRERIEARIIPGLNHDFHRVSGQELLREMVQTWAAGFRSEAITS